jgi:hypothetical protein
MSPEETAVLLAKCASVDQRTVGRADVLSWHELVGHLPLADALEAVKRWYSNRRDRIMPSDVIDGARAIGNERAQSQPHEIRALPSRFEADQVRDQRIQRGVQHLALRWSVPEETAASNTILEKALERARRESKGRQTTTPPKRHRPGGPGIQLDKVTKPPEWADDKTREAQAIRTLHDAGRHCGRRHCGTCTTTPTSQEQPA